MPTPAPASASPSSPSPPPASEHGVVYMFALSMMVIGNTSVDWLMNFMVPITLRHFTSSATLIAGIIDVHRLFGFIVEPYVAWKGDRVQTRFGRRRPFLLVGKPGALIFNLLFGALPFLIPDPQARHTVGAIAIVVAVYVILQFFVEINFGCENPMFADAFPQKKLGTAAAMKQICERLMNIFMAYYAMKWAATSEIFPYVASSALLFLSFMIAVFIFKEDTSRPIPEHMRKERYRIVGQLGLLRRNRDYLKLATIGSFAMLYPTCYRVFTSLFAKETLGLSIKDIGSALGLAPLVALTLAWPVGLLTNRIGPNRLMVVGFVGMAGASAGMGLYVHDYHSLLVFNTLGAFFEILVYTPMVAMVFQYAPADERGKVYSLVQFVRSVLALGMTLLVGGLVDIYHNYRVAYIMCVFLAATAAVVTLTTRDPAVVAAEREAKRMAQGNPS